MLFLTNPKNKIMSNQTINNQPIPSPGIPEIIGVDYTTNWRTYISGIDKDPNYIRAFNIPMQDIASLADFTKCGSVRAYLGMDNSTDVSTLKLVLVPVDDSNLDILSIEVPDGSGGLVSQSSIYDFTTPCPQVCDIDSPLFS